MMLLKKECLTIKKPKKTHHYHPQYSHKTNERGKNDRDRYRDKYSQ